MTRVRWVELRARGSIVMGLVLAGWACDGAEPAPRCFPGQLCWMQQGFPSSGGSGGAAGSVPGASGTGGTTQGMMLAGTMGGIAGGAGGMAAAGGNAGSAGSMPAAGAASAGTSGSMSAAGSSGASGTAGTMAMAGTGAAGAAGTMAMAGSGGSAAGTGEFAAERQACVDTINMYRATVNLPPLMRGTPEQETCSDMGAKLDGDSGRAHGSAGMCRGLGGQNSCPGYSLRVGGGTVDGTLKFCLKQMWDEGEPAEGVAACKADRTGCFQEYGHWINMTETTYRTVACGFYKMANGSYWMNQNFGR